MAHKKGAGSTDNGRDSKSKRLGVKMFGGQRAIAGNVLVRQRGTSFHPGENVYMGRDHTLHAGIDGIVTFSKTKKDRRFVSIMPFQEVAETPANIGGKPAKEAAKAPAAEKPAPKAKAAPAPAPVVETPAAPVVEDKDWAEVSVAAEAPAVEEKSNKISTSAFGNVKLDDLKIVEGIGPKIEQLLKDGGINTWAELAAADVDRLREILDAAGPRYQIHDPSTWPAQAKFADEAKWEELKEYQDMLIGGRDNKE